MTTSGWNCSILLPSRLPAQLPTNALDEFANQRIRRIEE